MPAYDGSAGWRADLAGGVPVGEAHSALGDGVDIWGFVEGGAFAGGVLDAEIISEDEEDVRFFRREDGEGQKEGEEVTHPRSLEMRG